MFPLRQRVLDTRKLDHHLQPIPIDSAHTRLYIRDPNPQQTIDRRQTMSDNAPGILTLLIGLAVVIVVIAGVWKVFTKAGKPGWASLIPIYNAIVILEIAGRPLWWIILYLIPIVNIVVGIIVMLDLARSFGKGPGFGIGLVFLSFIFFPILGLGDSQYVGPARTAIR